MYKISEITRDILRRFPEYSEALGHGIVNYSALARKIYPLVEAEKLDTVSREAIAIALKRIAKEMEKRIKDNKSNQPIQAIQLRQNISVISYERSPTVYRNNQKLMELVENADNGFLHFDLGTRDANFIASQDIVPDIKRIMKNEHELIEFPDCSLVSIFHAHESLNYPGVCARHFRALAWEGVNLISFFHTYAELTFVVESFQAQKAHQVVSSNITN